MVWMVGTEWNLRLVRMERMVRSFWLERMVRVDRLVGLVWSVGNIWTEWN